MDVKPKSLRQTSALEFSRVAKGSNMSENFFTLKILQRLLDVLLMSVMEKWFCSIVLVGNPCLHRCIVNLNSCKGESSFCVFWVHSKNCTVGWPEKN